MRDIVMGALFLVLGLVLSIMTLLVALAPVDGAPMVALVFAFILWGLDFLLIWWGGYLLLVEPEPVEEAIAKIERLFGANVNN